MAEFLPKGIALPAPPRAEKDILAWAREFSVAVSRNLHASQSLYGAIKDGEFVVRSGVRLIGGTSPGAPPFATPTIVLGTVAAPGVANSVIRSDATIVAFDATIPSPLAAAAATGSVAFAARRDHVHIFPPTLQSLANLAQLTYSDNATDSTLASSLGNLTISPQSGKQIILDPISAAASPTTPSAIVILRPSATGGVGLQPQYTGVDMSAGAVRCWNVLVSHTKQLIGSTIRGYDMTSFTMSPTAGSDANNTVQGAFLTGPLVNNANAGYLDVSALYLQGARRVAANPTLTQGNTLTVEATTIGSSIQAHIYLKQRAAQQVAATRYGIFADAMNSGTVRRFAGGSNSFESITDDFICSTVAKGLVNKDAQGTPEFWRSYVDSTGATVGGSLYAVNQFGVMAVSRAGGATGTLNHQIADLGTAAPAT